VGVTIGQTPASTALQHHVDISADQWPDDVRLSDIEPRVRRAGRRGADVRPKYEASANGHGLAKPAWHDLSNDVRN